MKIKRVLSLVLALTMIMSITTFCVTSNADDLLFNSEPKAITFEGDEKEAPIFKDTFTPNTGAKGMTLWLRISDAKEPFYLCKLAMNVSTRDHASLSTYNHGQDGVRHATWRIDGNGDYFIYIPYKHYSLQHQFIGRDGDYVTGITNITIAGRELGTANKDAKVALMGIFNNQVTSYESSFVVDGKKTTQKGEYVYKNCDVIPEGSPIRAGSLNSTDEAYDPVKGEVYHTGYTIDYSDTVRELWKYAYVNSALPNDPEKAGSVFAGWTDADGNPMIPYGKNEVKASFETSSSAVHTVTFRNGDNSVLSTVKVADGKTAVYRGPTPTKAGTDTTYFVYSGWDKSVMSVTSDLDVKPTFEEKDITYNVTYMQDDEVICVNTVKKYAESVFDEEKFELPTKNGDAQKYYEFEYWADENGAKANLKKVVSDMTVYVHFKEIPETKTYTISFVNHDGSKICDKTTGEHSYVEYDLDDPVRKPTETTMYTFSGWDVEDYKTLRKNTTVKALYEETPVELAGEKAGKVINKTSDFSTTDEVKIVEGYTFKTDTNYLTLTLKVEGAKQPFTLGGFRMKTTARDAEGKVSTSIDSNSSGNLISLVDSGKSTFTFTEDGYYAITVDLSVINWAAPLYNQIESFSFSNGASVCKQTTNLNDNLKVTFLALYEGAPDFTVRYYGEKGGFLGVGKVKNVCNNFGFTKLLPPDSGYIDEAPVKAEDADYRYNFAGWADKDGKKIECLYDNADVYAYFEPEIKDPVTVTFKNGDANAAVYTIPRGKTVTYDAANPIKPSTNDNSFIFRGWTTDPAKVLGTEVENIAASITEDMTYYAVFEKTDRMYIVNFKGEDGSDLGLVYVNKKDHSVVGDAPANPTKAADQQYSYTFDCWVYADGTKLDYSKVSGDITVKPKFASTLNKYTVTFMSEDGKTELGKVTVDYGTEAKIDDPVKESEQFHKFVFKGWSEPVTSVVSDMTVTAVFEAEFLNPFTDVPEDEWYYSAVQFVCENGYMSGMSNTTFEPDATTTRGMVVRVLYSAENEPSVEGKVNPFTDVPEDEWYTNAIKWAYDCGVVEGTSATTFEPEVKITRQEFCCILSRYAEKVMFDGKGSNMSIPSADKLSSVARFYDKNDVDSWALNSVKWCLYVECISGEERYIDGKDWLVLKPVDGMTRAEMASMLKRFIGNPKIKQK